jgi:signal transduction histidine kinase
VTGDAAGRSAGDGAATTSGGSTSASSAPATDPLLYTSISEHAGLAHDAGNLLGALRLYCDLLRSPGVLRPEHQHYATELHLIATRSSELMSRLLALNSATLQPGLIPIVATEPPTRLFLTGEPLSAPATVLRNLAPVLERIAAGAASFSLEIHDPDDALMRDALAALELPAEVLERIAVNLVRNAAEAIRSSRLEAGTINHETGDPFQPGHISLTLAVVEQSLQLTVEDNGPGMPPTVAAAFLRPVPLPPGAIRGLGHRIVHELIAQSHGTLTVRVRPRQGTIFTIRWPLRAAQTNVDAATDVHPAASSLQSEPQEGRHAC